MKLVNHYKQWQEAVNEAPLISHDQGRACYVRDHNINDKVLNTKLLRIMLCHLYCIGKNMALPMTNSHRVS